jgi:hypothetical protein
VAGHGVLDTSTQEGRSPHLGRVFFLSDLISFISNCFGLV